MRLLAGEVGRRRRGRRRLPLSRNGDSWASRRRPEGRSQMVLQLVTQSQLPHGNKEKLFLA